MEIQDMLSLAQWWGMFLLLGTIFLPVTARIFHHFPDKGYIFSKVIGLIFLSYSVFLLGLFRILPFTQQTTLFILLFFCSFFLFVSSRRGGFISFSLLRICILEEVLFFITLSFWSFIRAHQPDIHGLEKYMDYGFVNSILKSAYFPPTDMWFASFPINYYYFGHFFTAVATRLSFLPSSITYNLMIATLFALTFCASFSIGYNVFLPLLSKKKGFFISNISLAAGLLSACLVSLAGSLHSIYTLFKPYENENPLPFTQLMFSPFSFPNSYWYPNATRFIHNTIHEFPLYSFVVADLHGHVLSIPIVLTIIALLLHDFIYKSGSFSTKKILLLSFFLGVAYMTNAWDAIIYFLLGSTLIMYMPLANKSSFFSYYKNPFHALSLFYCLLLLFVGFLVFSFPFSYNFKPFVSGIGILCAPAFLTSIKSLGPFLFEADHCQHSPFWQLLILHGFFYFWVIVFVFQLKSLKKYLKTDIFVLVLIILSTLLIIVPEFIYAKDIYPAHYRANTMFKLVYEAFIMLSLSCGYIIKRMLVLFKPGISSVVALCIGGVGLWFVGMYPYYAISSYYENFQTYHGLDGTKYLRTLYPSDYEAISWINANIKTQPVILEAQGDSYTDFGRVSVNTGLPTVLGWTVHEWLWRGSYDVPAPRIPDIPTLYESTDLEVTKHLIKKYTISLVFIGELEKQKYTKLNEEKFVKLGKIIYQKGETKIYQTN